MDTTFIVTIILTAFFLFFYVKNKKKIEKLKDDILRTKNVAQQQLEEKIKLESDNIHFKNYQKKYEILQNDFSKILSEKKVLENSLFNEKEKIKEQMQLLLNAKQDFMNAFETLSVKALKSNQESFMSQANLNFEKIMNKSFHKFEQKEESINHMLKPVSKSLSQVDEKILELEKQRIKAYEGITQYIKSVSHSQKELLSQTSQLSQALKQPAIKGKWGEIQLRRLIELSGLSSHCDFQEQYQLKEENKTLRPDLVIFMPGQKKIIIDAKTPLSSYLKAQESSSELDQKKHLLNHAKSIKKHIQELSQKKYWLYEDDNFTPEFVVLFIPGDVFFSSALEQDASLIEESIKKNVMIATPTTLIAFLHSLAFGWKQEMITHNTKHIAKLGQEIYQRMISMMKHFQQLGKSLSNTNQHFNQAMSSIESRVLVSARKLSEYQNLSEQQSLSNKPQIDIQPKKLDIVP